MSSRTPLPQSRAQRIARSALVVLTLGGFGAVPGTARAQDIGSSPGGSFELRPLAGAFLPTGAQHDVLRDAFLFGGQASYRLASALAVTGTFAWSPNRDRLTRGAPLLDVMLYDVGLEGRAASLLRGSGWDFTPFLGAGLGGRTYRYRGFDAESRSKFAGYGAAGGELGFGRVGARVEARDYMSRFTPLTGTGDSETRNDVTLAVGLTVRF